ncbi:MAG TPA: class I SAM-dependent methyltransferase [Methanothrix sp.]|jgi:methyltransferase (TIGR00027 family)|nr:class I SAM-dependent methyltransferase [Methanothrix sp.]
MQKSDSMTGSTETNVKSEEPSKMAEMIALQRVAESTLPEGTRVCYDPYAIHFVSPEVIEFARKNPEKTKAMREHYERLFPGLGNSIRARVRYFDDFVAEAVDDGIEQLVVLGAGYDTRAYRIDGLKERVKVFEVDHPDTQEVKMEKIEKIFGALPLHVAYVPLDFEKDGLGPRLMEMGYDRSKKTLFVMEGLIMYIPPKAVDDVFSFIVNNSGKGSWVIFDYYPDFMVDGESELDVANNIRNFLIQQGEPLKFGIREGSVEAFLTERGLSRVQNVTSEDYKRAYFHGKNEGRAVCSLLSFAHAMVE